MYPSIQKYFRNHRLISYIPLTQPMSQHTEQIVNNIRENYRYKRWFYQKIKESVSYKVKDHQLELIALEENRLDLELLISEEEWHVYDVHGVDWWQAKQFHPNSLLFNVICAVDFYILQVSLVHICEHWLMRLHLSEIDLAHSWHRLIDLNDITLLSN